MTQFHLNDILQQIEQEIEIDAQGRGKASIRATARLAGVSDMALKRRKSGGTDSVPPPEVGRAEAQIVCLRPKFLKDGV